MSGLCVLNTELTNLPLLILYRRGQSWPRTLTYLCIRSERRHCCLSLVMFGLQQPFRAGPQAPAFLSGWFMTLLVIAFPYIAYLY